MGFVEWPIVQRVIPNNTMTLSIAGRLGKGLRCSLRRHLAGIHFEQFEPARCRHAPFYRKRSPTCRLPSRRLPVYRWELLGRRRSEPRIGRVVERDTVDVMSSSWRLPSKNSTVTRGCGLAVASFRTCST